MKYKYNGHLTLEERIYSISKEIMTLYPEINYETARTIATIEYPITSEPTTINHFMRLYNILFIIQKNKTLFTNISKDFIKTYQYYTQNNKNEKIDNAMIEIFNYLNNKTSYLPYINILA